MLVLFGPGLAFIKTRKTGGTSVEIWLSEHLGPGDIATPISPVDEELRAHTPAPCNHEQPPHGADPPAAPVVNHSTAREAAAFVGEAAWSELTTFTVERDPWERMVSLYHWRTRNWDHPPPFDQFIRERPPEDLSNSHLYMDRRGGLLVDHVLDHADLLGGLAGLAAEVGLPAPDLPRAKSGHRPPEATPERLFSPASRDYIAFACAREVELLGYEPPVLGGS